MSSVDSAIAWLAGQQFGVVEWSQLIGLGITSREIKRRIADGRLRRIHRGVYQVGSGPLAIRGRWIAAVLACGARAVLSHRDAATLHDLRKKDRTPVDVTVPGRRLRSQRGIAVHFTASLHPDDRAEIDGIPVTSIPRTLLDLALTLTPTQHRRAYEEAERVGALDTNAIRALLARSNGHGGVPVLRALLEYDPTAAAQTRSDLEKDFLDLIRAAALPLPQVNVLVEGFLVDAYWPEARLVVELDSWAYHRSREAFVRDRERLIWLRAAGIEVLPISDVKLNQEPDSVIGVLRRFLGPRGTN